jgi:hypothetical protein
VTTNTKWKLFEFNSDEDLVLLTNDGRLFLIDIVLGIVKDKFEFGDYATKSNENIVIEAARLDQTYNTLVFRTEANRFYFVTNI